MVFYRAAGVDIQSQEAYELAVSGLVRPRDTEAGPVIYGLKCVQFDPPNFTIGMHIMIGWTFFQGVIISYIVLNIIECLQIYY